MVLKENVNKIMNITIIGSGYVGLVTGACFAEVGHHVICVDNDKQKIATLQKGQIPIYEPGLDNLIRHNVAAQRLRFTTSIGDGVENSELIFIAVPTPPEKDGSVNLDFIEQVAREIAEVIPADRYRVIVDKSTVPVKTAEKVDDTIRRYITRSTPTLTWSATRNSSAREARLTTSPTNRGLLAKCQPGRAPWRI
jgi:UDPglucose 6-dehydrogenase